MSLRLWLHRIGTLLLLCFVLIPGREALNQEGIALQAFRMQITRDPQGIFRTWNAQEETPCNWTGVFCDDDRHVEKLLIHNAGLEGTISPLLTGLPFLRTLSLSKNHLGGPIPPQLSLISTLWKLNLSANSLVGIVPSAFGKFPVLRMLDLSSNRLTGVVPPELFDSCSRLRYVALSDNLLLGSIPPSMSNCGNLEGIDLSLNGIQGSIPSELGRLSLLKFLDLRRNRLSGGIPRALGSCGRLEVLDLSHNMLDGGLPSELALLSRLLKLQLNDNVLSGAFPSEVLYLPALEFLNTSSNMLSGKLPDRLNRNNGCHALEVLDLSFNSLEGPIPVGLKECQKLALINLAHNNLSSYIPEGVGELVSLRSLDLSYNHLSGVIPVGIQQLRQLSVLRLEGNPIGGSIPDSIGNLELVQVIDFDNMKLEGSIPQTITRCRFLLELSLSNNSLNGVIPRSINNITYLRLLSLDHNKLHGGIPTEIGNLTHLESLDISFNNLTGFIPVTLSELSNLVHFNVSFNNLTGLIPRTGVLQKFGKSSYIGNTYLCGLPLSTKCSPLVWAGPALPPMFTEGRKTHVLSISAIIAIVAAGVIAVGVFIVTILNLTVFKRKNTELFVYESTPPSPESSTAVVGKFVLFGSNIPSKYENWQEGTKALVDKDCVIGEGPLGTVYKAVVDGGVAVAVKKLTTLGQISSQEEFEHEVAILGNVKHRNVVTMEGYYWSSSAQLLLSEYIPNDSLHRHLHQRRDDEPPLPWWRRFKIALGAARGLAYLHHDCRPQILLFNVKSTNILLDEEYEAHISDYGLRKFLPKLDSYISDRKLEQFLGYVAPEVAVQNSRLTDKCDVYSFGVVLLELVTGKQPVEYLNTDLVVLCEYARSSFQQGRGLQSLDHDITSPNHDTAMMHVLRLGLTCTAQEPSKRPTMAEVVQILELLQP